MPIPEPEANSRPHITNLGHSKKVDGYPMILIKQSCIFISFVCSVSSQTVESILFLRAQTNRSCGDITALGAVNSSSLANPNLQPPAYIRPGFIPLHLLARTRYVRYEIEPHVSRRKSRAYATEKKHTDEISIPLLVRFRLEKCRKIWNSNWHIFEWNKTIV